ncbi:hypothetical protein E2C01_083798 [Portunus trituberculatus]|uniref:Uncharacterized protein n=1 Tax=Portunus trituberculatus TaxID=210409 RepID=A0A5B7J291_PORTR|nr:hypothetical protein [Portunus trituberculatus]
MGNYPIAKIDGYATVVVIRSKRTCVSEGVTAVRRREAYRCLLPKIRIIK